MGQETPAEHVDEGGILAAARADQNDLLRVGEREVDREEHLAQRPRRSGEERAEAAQDPFRGLAPAGLAGDRLQPQEGQRRHRVAGRLRSVVARLLAREQLFAVFRGAEIAAVRAVGEARLELLVQGARLAQPARLARRLVQVHEPSREEGVVLEQPGVPRRTVHRAAREPAGGTVDAQQVVRCSRGALDEVAPREREARAREGGDRQPVPAGDDLTVGQRRRPLRPRLV